MIPFINKTDVILKPALIETVTPITPVKAISDSLQSQVFSQGKKFLATVESQLPNGNSKVLVAGQQLQMRLPENIRPGDKMTLAVIAREPQLKFLLQNDASLNATKNSSGTSNASNTPAILNSSNSNTFNSLNNSRISTAYSNNFNTASTSSISTTGRFLGSLTQDSTKATTTQPLTSSTPVLSNPPTNNVETPVLLQKALSQSGLFYESHQAQWVDGKKTLAQLQQEPQGKLSPATTNAATVTSTAALLNAETPVNIQSLPLVQHQLTTLDSGQIIWRGEIWPEQIMDWDITEHTHDENEQDPDESSPQWQTQLRLTLPNLGEITATLIFSSEDVRIKLHAPATETVELLKNNQPPLATALESAGLSIKALEIHADTEK